ncbi:hypothetical protein AVEN_200776-1 [Araneus ventricosus]|uniref:Uncharacterized protein n=1 Tax=Araneus ventricosus TaxID=182803 RepID=A0A4Y2DW59_ARAVE|nr:hypothetical protein AVEN_200776-1 [Araneus ventricosus]
MAFVTKGRKMGRELERQQTEVSQVQTMESGVNRFAILHRKSGHGGLRDDAGARAPPSKHAREKTGWWHFLQPIYKAENNTYLCLSQELLRNCGY